ncbi:hypothetical protein JX265_008194 [Neoarthrinium moseri]|uniref:A to I editase domain-containing protein n=1 Tax=Neoarthrinium moseri TaxID=1658444 RepID=A0A9Q0AME7_9PEZI|nr:hypothetical protein JX265_008194 [Neoarthrinium moseri]
MTVTPDTIASLVIQHFDGLPPKRKPLVRDNGVHEWVPLSGIVAQGKDDKLTCLSLATGMKCLPHAKLPQARGNVLHDWHAEVLAIRSFNRFVLDEVRALSSGAVSSSPFLRRRRESELLATRPTGHGVEEGGQGLEAQGKGEQRQLWHAQPFAWREDVKLHMYCSEAPCGDASMELTMAAQEDASPWEVPESVVTAATADASQAFQTLPGRSYFSHLGLVRRKPARGDAPATLSKSCSDKLSLKQCTSLLSSLTSLFVCPSNAYIHSLILPASQYSATGCSRAFSSQGRMSPLAGAHRRESGGGYRFAEFAVRTTDQEFHWSKRSVGNRAGVGKGGANMAASNLAVAWTGHGLVETTLGGTLQGRKAFDAKGASFASKRKMWTLAIEAAGLLGSGMVQVQKALAASSYQEVKDSGLLEARRRVKDDAKAHALKGWVKNQGDDDFGL